MDRKPIHMVRAAFHIQFRKAMESCGIVADDYLRKVGLPTEISDPESLLPEKPFWRLVNEIALMESIPDFGMRVAQTTPWHRIDSLAPLIKDCDTLANLLETFCELATSQASNVTFYLQRKRSRCWFSYSGEPVIKRDVQMELYRITSMIEMVQQSTGPGWHPEEVRLLIPETGVVDHCSILNQSKVTFSNPVSALSIQPELLQLPVRFTDSLNTADKAQDRSRVTSDFETAVRKIINSYASSSQITIDDLARLTDLTVRTLQRRLAAHNLNFKQMLSQARYAHACEKLRDTRTPIIEIAKSMGYSDPAYFTRAFRRWADLSPSSYRRNQSGMLPQRTDP